MDNGARPLAPPPEEQPVTAFRDDFYVRGREKQATAFREDCREDVVRRARKDQPFETPCDRRGGNYCNERGQRGMSEEVRGQRGDGVNPAWNDFATWNEGAMGRGGGALGGGLNPPQRHPRRRIQGQG